MTTGVREGAAADTGPGARSARRRRGRAAGRFAAGAALAAGLALTPACGLLGDDAGRPAPSPTPTSSWDTGPDSIAAVGDSITRGFDACSLLSDCASASWATGTDKSVDSLARRLLDDPAKQSWNYAVSGSVMAGLPEQMARAAKRKPDLVTVMSGANDACRPTVGAMTPVADFRRDFREALRTLRRGAPRAQVYVAGVPDLKRLWQQGRDDPLGVRVWRLGICQSMLRDAGADTPEARERRAAVDARVREYNTVLREECAKVERCRDDGGTVFSFRFTAAELSQWDWFHPSKEGQRELAELAYRRITARNVTD